LKAERNSFMETFYHQFRLYCIKKYFLTAACCPKRDFYTHTHPSPSKNSNRLLYCILKIARLLYCAPKKKQSQKSRQKVSKKLEKKLEKGGKKGSKKVGKSLFLSLSCCCLETGLKPVLFRPNHTISHCLEITGSPLYSRSWYSRFCTQNENHG